MTSSYAQVMSGIVIDSASLEPLEFVNIIDLNTRKGTVTNLEGYFELMTSFPAEITFSFLGYNSKTVNLLSPLEAKNLRIVLSSQSLLFNEVVLESERSNIGKEIIQKIIKNKKDKAHLTNYSCQVYQQTTMTRIFKESVKDSIGPDSIKIMYLNEKASEYYTNGNDSKKIILAEIKQTGDRQLDRIAPMSNASGFRGSNRFVHYNPLEFFSTQEDFEIDIYDNSLNHSTISDRPITSPIANTALANYKYRLTKMEFVGPDTIFTISVIPLFRSAPLWEGNITVHSNGYYIPKVELLYNPTINGFDSLNVSLFYTNIDGSQVPTEKRITYAANLGAKNFAVKSIYKTSNYILNPDIPKNFYSSERERYNEEALKPNAELMLKYRGVALEKDLKLFFTEQDSIYRSITSDEYLRKEDSTFNKITWKRVLYEGMGHRNRAKGMTYNWSSLLESFQVLGVDGFRISPSLNVKKEFASSNILDAGVGLNYGLSNKDLKYRFDLGYTFLPKKFARIYIGGGDIFDLVTIYQSLDAIIARSNFINNRYGTIGYSMELTNGLYMNTSLKYSDKQSVANLSSNIFSEYLFGGQETAIEFERYRIFTFEADLIYRFGQKYVTQGRKKIVLPDNNPSIKLFYRKGVPGVINSEVNFDYLELVFKQKLPSTKIGSLNYLIKAGSFLSKVDLRTLEFNFFRGSTKWIFTNPLRDLQQIGRTRSTANSFFQASAIHHFDGFFLNKIPLINRLQMELLAGAGTLIIPDNNLYHIEFYTGIGKKIKIWGETMQIACYAVTSDNNLSNAKIEYKFGLNFYNAFAREWLY